MGQVPRCGEGGERDGQRDGGGGLSVRGEGERGKMCGGKEEKREREPQEGKANPRVDPDITCAWQRPLPLGLVFLRLAVARMGH